MRYWTVNILHVLQLIKYAANVFLFFFIDELRTSDRLKAILDLLIYFRLSALKTAFRVSIH